MNTIFSLPMDIYKNRRLVAKLAKNDFKTRYAGSYLGIVWAFIQPVITILVYGSRYCSMVLFPGCADRGDKFSAGIQLSGKKSRF